MWVPGRTSAVTADPSLASVLSTHRLFPATNNSCSVSCLIVLAPQLDQSLQLHQSLMEPHHQQLPQELVAPRVLGRKPSLQQPMQAKAKMVGIGHNQY